MPLAEYLASEQAREDVRDLLVGDKPGLPILGSDDLCLVRDEVEAWRTVMLWDDDQNKELTAYYRPDGDRYVVTDLGEGVRALRLRTGQPIEGWQSWFDGIVDSTAGVIRKQDVRADQLPDAICRVMLASLRVAQS